MATGKLADKREKKHELGIKKTFRRNMAANARGSYGKTAVGQRGRLVIIGELPGKEEIVRQGKQAEEMATLRFAPLETFA